jgi:large subunit ribosomal protein L15
MGFRSHRPVLYQLVDMKKLAALEAGQTLDAMTLKARGLVRNIFKPYKVVGNTELKQALTIEAYGFSKKAAELIARAGGKAVVVDQQRLKERIRETEAPV